jgi:peptidoglycan/LPS O-acetylase OafA/YrhL
MTSTTSDTPALPRPRAADDDRLRGRFVFLDGLRGITAVAIALFHFNNQWFSPTHRDFSALLPAPVLAVWSRLDLGVELFFVISGFVMAHSLWARRVTLPFIGNFILRFMARLSPPYWVVLFATMGWPYLVFPTLMAGFFDQFGGWTGLLINMFYLPDVLGRPRMVPVAWTVFLEVQFYLAFIALLWLGDLCGRRSAKLGRAVLAASFALVALASAVHWFRTGANDFSGRWWTFAIGSIIYAAVRRSWNAPAVLAGLALLTVVGMVRNEPHSLVVAGTCALVYVSAAFGGLKTWLGSRPLQYLGRISYSLYLVHIPVGIGMLGMIRHFGDKSATSTVTGVVAGLLMSLLVADLLHRVVEAPAARLSGWLRPGHKSEPQRPQRSP